MGKKNLDIRAYAKDKNIPLWRVAEKYGMADSNFSRMLRHELSEDKKAEIRGIIDELSATEQ